MISDYLSSLIVSQCCPFAMQLLGHPSSFLHTWNISLSLHWWLMMFIYFPFACILHTFAIPLSLLALWWTQVFCIFSDVYLKYLSLQIGCADWIKVKVLGERILRIQKKPFHNRLPADFCFNSSFWNILSRYLSSLALERVTAIAKMAMCKAAFAIVLRPCLKSWSFSKCETIDLFVLLLSRNWLSLWKATIISWPTIKHPDGVPGAKYGAAFVRVVYLGPFERIVCWRGWGPLPP